MSGQANYRRTVNVSRTGTKILPRLEFPAVYAGQRVIVDDDNGSATVGTVIGSNEDTRGIGGESRVVVETRDGEWFAYGREEMTVIVPRDCQYRPIVAGRPGCPRTATGVTFMADPTPNVFLCAEHAREAVRNGWPVTDI